MSIDEFREQMNSLGQLRVPFLFIVDFEMMRPLIFPLDQIDPARILYDVNGVSNASSTNRPANDTRIETHPISPDDYQLKFDRVYARLAYGDSYLTNLTIKTEISLRSTLRDIFYASRARYKLLMEDSFLVFSPEIFIQVRDGIIRSYPMKGTIDARIEGAAALIMGDEKEMAEHVTIVDLIRNDLSTVAFDVQVERFRYLEKIRAADRELLQVSSAIRGTVTAHYAANPGDLLLSLLPAGSVSGAPKAKTAAIIAESEGEPRGYYSGVFGLFDGATLDSGVMIRFIEQQDNRFYYRSGGGITTRSTIDKEYQEAIDKIYVPVS